jgi:ZIP family zinc transporter
VNPGLFAAAPTSSSGNSGSKAMSPLLPVLSGERLISRQSTGQLSGSGRLVVSSHHPQQDKTPGLDSANPAERAAALMELRSHHSGLMRLGVIMAITMTLHNLPEGFAVAFSAFR